LQETKYNKNLVERHASQPRKRLFIFLTTPLDKEPLNFDLDYTILRTAEKLINLTGCIIFHWR